jgi:hypothetical protein
VGVGRLGRTIEVAKRGVRRLGTAHVGHQRASSIRDPHGMRSRPPGPPCCLVRQLRPHLGQGFEGDAPALGPPSEERTHGLAHVRAYVDTDAWWPVDARPPQRPLETATTVEVERVKPTRNGQAGEGIHVVGEQGIES